MPGSLGDFTVCCNYLYKLFKSIIEGAWFGGSRATKVNPASNNCRMGEEALGISGIQGASLGDIEER